MKCHQRVIREQEALLPEPDEHLKREAAASFKNAVVREITREEAATIIHRYEWLKNLGQTRWTFGLIFRHPTTGQEFLGGVACFGDSAGTNVYAAICGEEWKRKAITLVRGACVPWADRVIHKGEKVHTGAAASFLINRACRLMTEKGFHAFIAYSDEAASEVGTVYQASGWQYVGRGGTDIVQRRSNGRLIGSKIIASKIKDRTGLPDRKRGATMADVDKWAEEARRSGYTVKGSGWYRYKIRKHDDGRDMTRAEVKQQLIAEYGDFKPSTPKHRYVHFCGDKRTVKSLRKALKLPVLTYPKRSNTSSPMPDNEFVTATQANGGVLVEMPKLSPSKVFGAGECDTAFRTISLFANAQDANVTVPSRGFTSTDSDAASVEAVAIPSGSETKVNIVHDDVLEALRSMPDAHFSGCLTDPPYELGFMSRPWDKKGIAHSVELWSEVYRVLAPGSYLLAFGGTRTFHRLTCAIEDAGFQVREHLMWLYGTGFPKSKACLKPGYEPIVLAYKNDKRQAPLNIDECRVNPGEVIKGSHPVSKRWREMEGRTDYTAREQKPDHTLGRWPSNVILDKKTSDILDGQTCESYGDQDGASRFFYCSKASQSERNAGLPHKNPHVCVKPLDLCRWLAKLIRRDGRLLVPFSGSGSEMIAGLQAGWSEVVGIEREGQYVEVAKARVAHNLDAKPSV